MKKRTLFLSITAAGIAGAAAFRWMTILNGFSACDKPSAMEAIVARTARKLSIPASERDAKNPFTPAPWSSHKLIANEVHFGVVAKTPQQP